MAEQKIENQTRALAAVFQCCGQIHRIANTGFWDERSCATVIRAIGVTNPDTVDDIYTADQLTAGFELVATSLSKSGLAGMNADGSNDSLAILMLFNKIMALSGALQNRKDVFNELGNRIDAFHDRMLSENQGFMDGELQAVLRQDVLRECATIYQSVISPNCPKLLIPGREECLKVSENQEKIRTLLLAAIRGFVLWDQLGASKFMLLFHRGRIVQCAQEHLVHN